ncbi:hypothetical protein ABFS83_01G024100 [Erythranthe nasuta]
MAESLRRTAAIGGDELDDDDDVMIMSEFPLTATTDVEPLREKLRQRWELASVLNFLHVFEPLIGSDLKISAEEVETSLIEQNKTLAHLHITLLKGIIQESKILKGPDAWMISLSKTLSKWWPWVAEGKFPLTGAKGEEISLYKELEPTTRLLVLKALCEVRADQYDAVSYINDEIKSCSEVSKFCKDKLAGDENGIAFWYDGNETIGHRLYKEIHVFKKEQGKSKGKVPVINSKWETLATNLEEFKKIVDEYSSSELKWEVDVSNSVQNDVIPILEKEWKKKERKQHQQQRQKMLLRGFRNSGIARSCRGHKTIDYRFDDYDRAITEAIQYANKRKTSEEPRQKEKPSQRGKKMETTSNESNNSDHSSTDNESTESDVKKNSREEKNAAADDSSDEEYDEEKEDDDNKDVLTGQVKVKNKMLVQRPKGSRFSNRLAGIPGHTVPESMDIGGAKNRLRQGPPVNTAADSVDSEDEKCSS